MTKLRLLHSCLNDLLHFLKEARSETERAIFELLSTHFHYFLNFSSTEKKEGQVLLLTPYLVFS